MVVDWYQSFIFDSEQSVSDARLVAGSIWFYYQLIIRMGEI